MFCVLCKKSGRSLLQAQRGGTVRRFGEPDLALIVSPKNFRLAAAPFPDPIGAYGGPVAAYRIIIYSTRRDSPSTQPPPYQREFCPILAILIADSTAMVR